MTEKTTFDPKNRTTTTSRNQYEEDPSHDKLKSQVPLSQLCQHITGEQRKKGNQEDTQTANQQIFEELLRGL